MIKLSYNDALEIQERQILWFRQSKSQQNAIFLLDILIIMIYIIIRQQKKEIEDENF